MRVDGQVAEVWQAERQVGTLWDWHFEGHASKWLAFASRQSFAQAFKGGDVEVRFLITASSEHVFQLRGEGQVTEFVAGSKVKHPCRMEGTRAWSLTAQLSGLNSNGTDGLKSEGSALVTLASPGNTHTNGDGRTVS